MLLRQLIRVLLLRGLSHVPVHATESGHNVLVVGLFHTQLAAHSLMLIPEDGGNKEDI